MNRLKLSIRTRLLLWFGSLLACILAGFGVTAYELDRRGLLAEIDEALERRVSALQDDLRRSRPPAGSPRGPAAGHRTDGPPPPNSPHDGGADSERAASSWPGPPPAPPAGRSRPTRDGQIPEQETIVLSPRTAGLFDETDPLGFYYATWARGGAAPQFSANAPSDMARPRFEGGGRTYTQTRGHYREIYYFTELEHCVLAGISIDQGLQASRRFAWWLAIAGAGVLAIGLGGAWWLTTHALRPVKQIGTTARRIADGNLAERIPSPDAGSELGQLADVLNSTFARLEAAFAEQRNFTADASHELRTPIAALVTTMQGLLARERSGEEYRETVAACLRTVQQMRRLTESLLVLARFDAGEEPPARAATDLAEIARTTVEMLTPLALSRSIRIECTLEPAPLSADEGQLGQVATNLIANAIYYNREGGRVDVRTTRDADAVVLEVADNGPGIAPEDLPHVFKRFYRADKARSRTTGRSGLGLAICKSIVDAHGGTMTASSQAGVGTTMTVRLSV